MNKLLAQAIEPRNASDAEREQREQRDDAIERMRDWHMFVTVSVNDRSMPLRLLMARAKRLVERVAKRTGQHVVAIIGADQQRHGAPHVHLVLSYDRAPSKAPFLRRVGTYRPRARRGQPRAPLTYGAVDCSAAAMAIEDTWHAVTEDLAGVFDVLVEHAYGGAAAYTWAHRETAIVVGCCRGSRGCHRCPKLSEEAA